MGDEADRMIDWEMDRGYDYMGQPEALPERWEILEQVGSSEKAWQLNVRDPSGIVMFGVWFPKSRCRIDHPNAEPKSYIIVPGWICESKREKHKDDEKLQSVGSYNVLPDVLLTPEERSDGWVPY